MEKSAIDVEQKLAQVKLKDTTAAPGDTEVAAGPRQTPFVEPASKATSPGFPELTAEQQTKYNTILETVKSWTEIPAAENKGGPVTDAEKFWLTRECLLRYLRATKWSTADATKRLLGTLTWRREYGVTGLTGDYVSEENETGKQFILGFDNDARTCLYLNPGRQNTEPSPRQVQHLVFMVERAIDMMVPGQETLALLINFKASKNRSNTAPGIGQGREVLSILQTHYPERLGRALIINVPWVVKGFFTLITPFIDPLTRQKLKFNDDMKLHVPAQQLWNEFHGELEFEYDHSVYWPTLLKLCEEKHTAMWDRWVKAGKKYGESEVYLRSADAASAEQSGIHENAAVSADGVGDTTSSKLPVS